MDEAARQQLKNKLLSKIRVSENGCWEWTAGHGGNGYGNVWFAGKRYPAHRASYMAFIGDISPDLCACHRCDNPNCINPDHLFPGTKLQNNQDRHQKGRSAGPKGDKNWQHSHVDLVLKGERHPFAKLTDAEVASLRKEYSAGGVYQRELAAKYGISRSHVANLVRFTEGRGGKHG
jgi:hypothetical protein